MNRASQCGILEEIPAHGRVLAFHQRTEVSPEQVLATLSNLPVDGRYVVGFGLGLVQGLQKEIPGLRAFPVLTGPGCSLPSTQADLWCWVRGENPGDVLHHARAFSALVAAAFTLAQGVELFKYGSGLDLTGYEDGTENPKGDDALHAALVAGCGAGLDGSSFVAVQQWQHDLARFEAYPRAQQDQIFGRRLQDNEEMEDAPAYAHVKRTAQESFSPEAFVLRRSMPWADASGEGLVFIAFGRSLDAYEAQLRRMMGLEDGIMDGLFRFTRPLTGSYYWCHPASEQGLDLSMLGL
ncbi:Dyp-type peroxidase family [Magnetococcus marinus MC-1]|uniref:Dyp-type peroxidase family n=1 Tax=Magnetococcus marinus (strain ATCC BAA-1437 / JCM 17883 / MC-1) TaxID=156889 RepID=A0LAN2_MAGMM|nr:Dyp-type peroxidase [Magnetococcus marinus]ABK45025.1 Dyp-type peroxidase family [Magnetococcus marinus MC-1]